MKFLVRYFLIGVAVLLYRISHEDDTAPALKKANQCFADKISNKNHAKFLIGFNASIAMIFAIFAWPYSIYRIFHDKIVEIIEAIDD